MMGIRYFKLFDIHWFFAFQDNLVLNEICSAQIRFIFAKDSVMLV